MSNEKNAQELLRWGLSNSVTSAGPSVEQVSADIEAGRRPDLADPQLYDAIMGKSEAVMMREQLSVAVDETRELDDRCTALDNFEMLIEQIDNANNITSMQMWTPLIDLLSSNQPRIQTAAAWILGTAVQNNDKAQVAVLQHEPVKALLELLGSGDESVRAKAMYALSALVRHNPAAMSQLDRLDGWKALRAGLVDSSLTLRRKTAFLLSALLFQDPNSFTSNPQTPQNPQTSSATALAPRSTPTPATNNNAPAVPLELGPETMRAAVPHPNVARAMVDHNILTTLLSSLLPPSTAGVDESDLPPPSGPDGDLDARTDLDFAEKAAAAIIAFTTKLPPQPNGLDQKTKSLFKAFLAHLNGPSLDPTAADTRAHELAIDPHQLTALTSLVNSL